MDRAGQEVQSSMIPTRAYGPGGCLSPAAGTGWAGQEQLWQDPKGWKASAHCAEPTGKPWAL